MVGAIASVSRPDLFSKLIILSSTPRLLNDENYYRGFEQEDIEQLFEGVKSNYKAWCSGFALMVVGGDRESVAVQEFSRTLFNMRPNIALSVVQVVFMADMRHVLACVGVPCHILHSAKDKVVPIGVSKYMHQNLGGPSIVEIMLTCGHLLQLSSPDIVIPIILNHIPDIN